MYSGSYSSYVLKNPGLAKNLRLRTITERQRISEILAITQYEKNKTIGINDIKSQVMSEFKYDDTEARTRIGVYYHDAINSTFLVKEQSETYRFILNPLLEYFVARRIEMISNLTDGIICCNM